LGLSRASATYSFAPEMHHAAAMLRQGGAGIVDREGSVGALGAASS